MKKGFTLIELVIMVAFMAVVGGIFGFIYWIASPHPGEAAVIPVVEAPERSSVGASIGFSVRSRPSDPAPEAKDLSTEVERLEQLVALQKQAITDLEANFRRDQLYSNVEYQVINDEIVRRQVVEWVVKHKLDVLPGDVEWLAERIRLDDWGTFETATEAVGHRFRRQLEEFP
jgi:hypothetical protein